MVTSDLDGADSSGVQVILCRPSDEGWCQFSWCRMRCSWGFHTHTHQVQLGRLEMKKYMLWAALGRPWTRQTFPTAFIIVREAAVQHCML